MKRFIIFLMCFTLLAGCLPPQTVYGATYTITDTQYPGFSALQENEKQELEKIKLANVPLSIGTGSSKMYVAVRVLMDYGIVVYNYPGQYLISKGFGDESGNGEYRYLGYDTLQKKVTNDLRYNDSPGIVDANALKDKNWTKVDSKSNSWAYVSPEAKTQTLTKPFTSDDGTETPNSANLTLKDILIRKVAVGSSDSSYYPYIQMQSAPTLATKGSAKLVHTKTIKTNGVWQTIAFYNSFTLPRIERNFTPPLTTTIYEDAACTKPITKLDILPSQTEVTVYVKVNMYVDMQPLGLSGQESKFIASVTNSLKEGGGGSNKLTDLSNPGNMATIYPIKLYWKDYSSGEKTLTYKGMSIIEPTYDVINFIGPFEASATLKVRAISPADPIPEFKIYHLGEDKTDQAILSDTETITKDYTFDLKDQSTVPLDNEIKTWNWFAFNNLTGKYDYYFGWTKDTTFTLRVADVPKYVKNGTISIQELITDKMGKQFTVTHDVSIIGKQAPADVLPKAYVFPPSMIRAGQKGIISGKGTSGSGTITNYQFDYGSGFEEIRSISQSEKEGTFLSYDTSVTTGLTVTDSAGKTATASDKTEVLHPIIPVFKTNGVYKINCTIELDSTESKGTTYYPIDTVTWTIKPMDGQAIESIKLHDGGTNITGGKKVVGPKPKVDFKQLGRYEVWMDVHSTSTYPGEEWRTASKQVYGIINVQPDTPPVAKLAVPTKVIRKFETSQKAYFDVWDESYSTDGDTIGVRRYYVRFDTDNDKSTSDEYWSLIYEGTASRIAFDSANVGNYEFKLEVEEANESTASPFWNPATDTIKANTDSQPLAEKMTEIINVAPITSLYVERKKLDLNIVTDYEGIDLATLRSQVDILTKDLFEKGVDVKIDIFTDKLSKGRVKAPVYQYTRYLRTSYTTDYQVNTGQPYTTGVLSQSTPWETRYQLETDYLPNYCNQSATYATGYYDRSNSSTGTVDYGLDLQVSVPSDPFKKNGSIKIPQKIVVPSSSIVETYNNIRGITVSVDGSFTKGAIQSYQDLELYCMDLDKLKSTATYRDGSDRQMVFVMKTGDSLTTLNQSFADFVKDKGITVTAISGFDMASQYGGLAVQDAEFIRKEPWEKAPEWIQIMDAYGRNNWNYNHFNAVLKGLAIQLEGGKQYAFTNPLLTWSGQYYPTADYPSVNTGYVKKLPGTPTDIQYIPLSKSYSSYYTPVVTTVAPLQSGNLVAPTTDWSLKPESNSKQAYVVQHRERNDEGRWETYYELGDRTTGQHMAGIRWGGDTGFFYFIKNGNLYSMPVSQMVNHWTTATLEGAGYREVPTDGIFNRDSPFGSAYTRNHLVYYNPSMDSTRFLYTAYNGATSTYHDIWLSGKIISFNFYNIMTDKGQLWTINRNSSYDVTSITLTLSDVKHVVSGFKRNPDYWGWLWNGASPVGPDLRNDAYTSGLWYISTMGDLKCYYNNMTYQITQGMNLKKLLVVNDESEYKWGIVFLTNDGKLLSPTNPFAGFPQLTGSQPFTPASCTSIVKEPRTLTQPVVDALSMRKLLNQSSTNKINSTFEEFIIALKSNYDNLQYQTQEIKLLDEVIKPQTLYSDYEGDPMHESAITISHNPSALENALGLDENHGKTLANWNGKLSKTGLYTLNPKVKDNPNSDDRFSDYRLWNKDSLTMDILVHRKPTASMRLSVSPNAPYTVIARDSNSLDLDHQSLTNRGITEVEWGFKKVYDDSWQITRGALGTAMSGAMETGETYIVSYRVKDLEGAWSDPVTEQIVAGMNLLMDAKLKAQDSAHNLNQFPTGNNVVLCDLWSSYPLAHHLEIQMLDGTTPIFSQAVLRKEWGHVRSEAYPERDWQDYVFNIPAGLADKTYTFKVTAVSDSNNSIRKTKSFNVTTVSNRAPTVSFTEISPQIFYEGDLAQLKIKVADDDNDLLSLDVYASYDGKSEQLIDHHENLVSGSIVSVRAFTIGKGNTISLRAVVKDLKQAEGQASVNRPIHGLGIKNVSLTGAWNHWRGQTNAFGEKMTNEPYRFLAYEKIQLELETDGEPDRVSLRLEGPLEAMNYQDSKGKWHSYKEELGYDVAFPIIFRKTNVNIYYLEYILPLANSTITYANERKRPPYQLMITLEKDGRARTLIYGDQPGEPGIDLTGNIFDLIYNQPAKRK